MTGTEASWPGVSEELSALRSEASLESGDVLESHGRLFSPQHRGSLDCRVFLGIITRLGSPLSLPHSAFLL